MEKPEMVIEAMEIRPGMTVAEIGAGSGFFSRRLAKAVGPTGKVYAEDIQPEMLELLKKNDAKEGITTASASWAPRPIPSCRPRASTASSSSTSTTSSRNRSPCSPPSATASPPAAR